MASLFVAVEGPNGVGKTTIAAQLALRLATSTSRPVHLTGEPSDTPLGRLLRQSESVLHGRSLALALAADRANHMETEIIPALDDGSHVVTDRYVQSSLVLQAIDGLEFREIWSYNRYVLPAITFYLEDDPGVIANRLSQRRSLSRLEMVGTPQQELTLYRKALTFLRRQSWQQHVIDCRGKTPALVVGDILQHLNS